MLPVLTFFEWSSIKNQTCPHHKTHETSSNFKEMEFLKNSISRMLNNHYSFQFYFCYSCHFKKPYHPNYFIFHTSERFHFPRVRTISFSMCPNYFIFHASELFHFPRVRTISFSTHPNDFIFHVSELFHFPRVRTISFSTHPIVFGFLQQFYRCRLFAVFRGIPVVWYQCPLNLCLK